MPPILQRVQELVRANKVLVSDHGFDELLEDNIDLELLLQGIARAVVVEEYPLAFKGPSVLVLQDHGGKAAHVVWGISRDNSELATLVTAYFPDPAKWHDEFLQRKPK